MKKLFLNWYIWAIKISYSICEMRDTYLIQVEVFQPIYEIVEFYNWPIPLGKDAKFMAFFPSFFTILITYNDHILL